MSQTEGNRHSVEWSRHVHHQHCVDRAQSVEQVHGRLLVLGIDYAAVMDGARLVGLVSFRMLSPR